MCIKSCRAKLQLCIEVKSEKDYNFMGHDLVLNIENLEVSFEVKDIPYFVLRSVNLELYTKQKIAIVGESGSGKTTLANSILLFNDKKITTYFGNINFYPIKKCDELTHQVIPIIFTEEIEKEDRTEFDIHTLDEKFMSHVRGFHISMIFQDPFTALNPVLRVGEQVGEVIKIHNQKLNKKEIYDKVIELFTLVHLPEPEVMYKKYPHQLSGGQIQRVCVATAIANRPEILIADEPTTALDASLKESILSLLSEMTEKFDTSLILITHDISIIKNYVDYIYILYAGEVLESGPTKQIFYNPLHPYTQFLFSCYVDKTKKGQKLPSLPYEIPDLSDQDFIFEKCIFLNRCQKKIKRCEEEKPEVYSVKGQKVKCFLYEK